MAKSKKIECKVIRSGFMWSKKELPIGEIVHLTERQVKSFVGKIKSLKEVEAEAGAADKSLKGFAALEKDNDKLSGEIDELNGKVAALVEANEKLEKAAKK